MANGSGALVSSVGLVVAFARKIVVLRLTSKPSWGLGVVDSLHLRIIIQLFPGLLFDHQYHRFVCARFSN